MLRTERWLVEVLSLHITLRITPEEKKKRQQWETGKKNQESRSKGHWVTARKMLVGRRIFAFGHKEGLAEGLIAPGRFCDCKALPYGHCREVRLHVHRVEWGEATWEKRRKRDWKEARMTSLTHWACRMYFDNVMSEAEWMEYKKVRVLWSWSFCDTWAVKSY